MHNTCAKFQEEWDKRRGSSDWNGDPRVAREAYFIPYRGPNGDGTCSQKGENHAMVIKFPEGTMQATGMQRRMRIGDGDTCFRGVEEDVIELFACSDYAHDMSAGVHGMHAKRGQSLPDALDPEHRVRYNYRSTKLRRRRDPEAEDLRLVVSKRNLVLKQQRIRDAMVAQSAADDRSAWEDVAIQSGADPHNHAVRGILHRHAKRRRLEPAP